jgi:hypothetical protein
VAVAAAEVDLDVVKLEVQGTRRVHLALDQVHEAVTLFVVVLAYAAPGISYGLVGVDLTALAASVVGVRHAGRSHLAVAAAGCLSLPTVCFATHPVAQGGRVPGQLALVAQNLECSIGVLEVHRLRELGTAEGAHPAVWVRYARLGYLWPAGFLEAANEL